jgi:hypothetical protein
MPTPETDAEVLARLQVCYHAAREYTEFLREHPLPVPAGLTPTYVINLSRLTKAVMQVEEVLDHA